MDGQTDGLLMDILCLHSCSTVKVTLITMLPQSMLIRVMKIAKIVMMIMKTIRELPKLCLKIHPDS